MKAKKQMDNAKIITQDHATWAIKQIQSVITVKRWWFPIYRALVQKKLNDEDSADISQCVGQDCLLKVP